MAALFPLPASLFLPLSIKHALKVPPPPPTLMLSCFSISCHPRSAKADSLWVVAQVLVWAWVVAVVMAQVASSSPRTWVGCPAPLVCKTGPMSFRRWMAQAALPSALPVSTCQPLTTTRSRAVGVPHLVLVEMLRRSQWELLALLPVRLLVLLFARLLLALLLVRLHMRPWVDSPAVAQQHAEACMDRPHPRVF